MDLERHLERKEQAVGVVGEAKEEHSQRRRLLKGVVPEEERVLLDGYGLWIRKKQQALHKALMWTTPPQSQPSPYSPDLEEHYAQEEVHASLRKNRRVTYTGGKVVEEVSELHPIIPGSRQRIDFRVRHGVVWSL